jgi:hypothetical protein
LSLGPALARKEVPFVLLPPLQEVSNIGCDVGLADTADDIKRILPTLFAKDELPFDYNKIDASHVTKGWNSKVRSIPATASSDDLCPSRKGIGHMRETQYQSVQQI